METGLKLEGSSRIGARRTNTLRCRLYLTDRAATLKASSLARRGIQTAAPGRFWGPCQ
jgi:hypothetical protein